MTNVPAWVDGEVTEGQTLTNAQIERLLRMMEVLRDPANLKQIAEIKENCHFDGDSDVDSVERCYEYALILFQEFSEAEQQALWVAPKWGGIFTTHERKILRNDY